MSDDSYQMTPEVERIFEALLRLNLQDGDIVFIDPHVIDFTSLMKIPDPFRRRVYFVAARPLLGHTLKESVYKMSKEDLKRFMEAANYKLTGV